jgi:signal transduction histidine kinase
MVGYRAPSFGNPAYVAGTLLVFDTLLILLVTFVSSTARRLHRRTRELAEARERTERSARKTRAVLETARTIGGTLDMERETEALARAAVRAVGARAASIRVLDPQGQRLELNASFGLSREYLEKGAVSASRGTIDRRVLNGETVAIEDVTTEPGFQYPEEARREGLRSAMCVPLILPERGPAGEGPSEPPMGVLRVYTGEPHAFTEEETGFLAALASQGAVALANALAYDQLRKLENAKSRFVFAVAHQLKSPVGVMQGKLEMLQEGYVGDLAKEQRDAIAVALRRLAGLQALIRDLLTLAALEGQSGERVAAEVDVRAVVRKVLEQVRPDAAAKGIEVRAEAVDPVPAVRANPADFELVVANLVENALKYTPPAGEVRVRIEPDGGHLCLTVSDTGIGVAKDDLPRLFDEFFRTQNAIASREAGTGLGLSLVRRIVDLYRGTIAVASEQGKGTTFTVRWPAPAPA